MEAIEVEGLSKRFGTVQALDAVTFAVHRGELFGLIGPDGAGKTTLFRLLATLLTPDSGRARVGGCDIVQDYRAIRSRVGYMPGRFSLYGDLTVEENLRFFAALFGVTFEASYDLIAPVYRQIEPFRRRRAAKLSGGMKQKLALSCALIHRPEILFLDEPTTGVDAVSRSEFWEMLDALKRQGMTILVSTPYMDEASRCDRIALCNEGHLLGIDTPEALVRRFEGRLYAIRADAMFALLGAARRIQGVEACYPFGETHHLVAGADFDVRRFTRELGPMPGLHIEPTEATIEDVFIQWMKR